MSAGASQLGRFLGHASAFETSLVLAGWPALVQVESVPHRDDAGIRPVSPSFESADRTELHGSWHAIDGYSGSPDLAGGQLGHAFFEVATRRMAQSYVEFWRTTQSAGLSGCGWDLSMTNSTAP